MMIACTDAPHSELIRIAEDQHLPDHSGAHFMLIHCAITLAAMALNALGIIATADLWDMQSIAGEDLLGGAL